MSGRGFVAVLGVLFAGYTGAAGWLPPLDDELYYWCWAKDLQLSYYDHPPMTALMIRASTEVFGDTLFAVRFPACVAMVAVLGVIGWLTRPRGILFGTVLTPLFTFGAVVMTPDTPLLLFWSLYLGWLVLAHRRLTPTDGSAPRPVPVWHWAVGGLVLGCGILGKYTTGLAVPAGLLSFLLLGFGSVRAWAMGYLIHLLVAFVTASPILIHNLRHDFVPLLYQWRHAAAADEPGLKAVGEFLGVQVLLTGTLPLVLLPWAAWRFRTLSADPRLRVCLCLYALPLTFFILKSSRGPLEGNWAMASYLAFWPLAAVWFAGLDGLSGKWRLAWKWGGRLAFAAPVVSVTALGVHLVHPLPILPPDHDRVHRLRDRDELIAAVADLLSGYPDHPPVFTDTYQNTALLRFHGVPARQEEGVSRPSQFTQTPERMADHERVYYFTNARREGAADGYVAGFDYPTLVAEFPLYVRGKKCDTYKLLCYQKSTDARPSFDPAVGTRRPPPPGNTGVFTTRP